MITFVCYVLAIPLMFFTTIYWMSIHHPDQLIGFLHWLEEQIDRHDDDRDEDAA